ncbi:MAG: site-2 protease family protein [Oscillospiraceae bacterium]|jgi:Zn-dependent protease|nr:site-2 protease family protein [Oscillospiraceae bacterium]
MSLKIFNLKIEIKFLFAAALAFALFSKDGALVLCGFFSSLLHELGHLAAMRALGDVPESVVFVACGIRIDKRENPIILREIIILLAGPLVNLTVFCILYPVFGGGAGKLSLIAVYNLALGVFNLLPVSGLDGGRLFELLVSQIAGEKTAGIICAAVSVIFLLPLAAGAFFVFFKNPGNTTLLVTLVFMLAALLDGKFRKA